MRNYVTINGVDSTSLAGFLIQELPPLSLPKMRTKTETIDGRDGDIITKLGYSAYDKEITIGLYGSYDIDKINEFFVSEGTIVFSNEPDKYYRFTMVDGIDYDRLVRFRTGKITFHCQPFKYDATETEIDYTNTFTEDNVPYIFRANTHDANMMKLKKVVGGTIAWNQLFDETESVSLDVANNSRASSKALPNGSSIRTGHKYLYRVTVSASENLVHAGNSASLYTRVSGTGKIINQIDFMADGEYYKVFASSYDATSDGVHAGGLDGALWLYSSLISSNTNGKATISHINLIDLTQMFGSTIADYIYSLEQAHAGDGVAWFKSLFPKAYYSYNAGELMSVKTSAHKTVGFNQWDEEWENGYYNRTTGAKAGNSDTTYYRSKNYIPCFQSTAYYIKIPSVHASNNTFCGICYYDDSKNFISATTKGSSVIFTTPSDAYYMTFYIEVGTSGASYQNDICINLSSSRNGEYEPYEEHTYPLDGNLTLRGIPKLDSNNELYYDGDTYASDGTVTRKYGLVDLGSLTWVADGTVAIAGKTRFTASVPNSVVSDTTNGIKSFISNGLPLLEAGGTYFGTDGYTIAFNNNVYIFVDSLSTGTASAFKTAMSGVYLVYELATPTTESADAYTQSQRVGATEEFVDGRTVEIPVGNDTLYYDGTPEIVVKNKGNTTSRPTLTIYGEGTITVSLNGDEIFTITMGDHEYITIDTEEMNAYMGGVLLNRSVTGDYSSFVLNAGDNTISLSGNVSEVLIDNYSRWL